MIKESTRRSKSSKHGKILNLLYIVMLIVSDCYNFFMDTFVYMLVEKGRFYIYSEHFVRKLHQVTSE